MVNTASHKTVTSDYILSLAMALFSGDPITFSSRINQMSE